MFSCTVCPHGCAMDEGTVGLCGARRGEAGKSVAVNYGYATALSMDPIEKKPLAGFYPGTRILSVGSFGCNLDCPFCQNCGIAHPEATPETIQIAPEELVRHARFEKNNRNIGIAFTYNEPLVGYEFVRDTARLAKKEDLKCVVVSNGYINDTVLDEILPLIDAWNIDLKGDDAFYRTLGGRLAPVLNTIKRASETEHVEVTTLVIPGKNDSPDRLEPLFESLAKIDPDIILHLSRFFPARHWYDLPPTDIKNLRALKQIAERYLSTVILGNV